ncbi:InlB B-repeat-containing protein [uncultured Treponema sp.]|uniref:InlB B-repeat-containing protein n=1 Tax=uncultured Treponema sp. TaxID=162155 RepID=UPI00260137F6|nr:InlB B-repeat-containing protein [uncultured Treponema sp.]
MKHFKISRFISCFVCASLFLITGCMDLYDDDEVPTSFTVTFVGNGGSYTKDGNPVLEYTQGFYYGVEVALDDNLFKREGYNFKGWSLVQDSETAKYADRAKMQVSADMTLYAVWEQIFLTVTYADGVESLPDASTEPLTVPATKTYAYGSSVTVDFETVPSLDGYTFIGWFDGANNVLYKSSDEVKYFIVTSHVVLRAQWLENSIDGSGIDIIWDDSYSDIELFSCKISGEKGEVLTFTPKQEYESCSWWISNSQDKKSTDKIFVWNTSEEKAGTYYVTLVASDGSDSYRASSMIVVVHK